MKLALTYPDLVSKLIVVDMAPKQYTNRHTMVFDAMRSVDFSTLEHRQDAKETLLEKLDGDEATTAFLLKNIRRSKTDGFSWKMNTTLKEGEKLAKAIVKKSKANEIFIFRNYCAVFFKPIIFAVYLNGLFV